VYEITVDKVISKGNLSDDVFKGRLDAYLKTQTDADRKAEPLKIKKYITDNNLKVTTTPSGLSYVITSEGTGPKPAVGDTVAVYYVGKFVSGKVFDTNIKAEAQKAKMQINPMNPYKPLRFALGITGMIQGWNEALPLLNKGTKATLILPSSLAYGEKGNQQIPGFTPLIFDVELVDITHPNPNAPKPAAPPVPLVQPQQPVKK
jgi:FKBP-type peptidyl-prolyl cis-trans isomerase